MAHPVVGADRVGLHQRHDHEAAAERQRADLQRGPGERAACRRGASRGGERDRERRPERAPREHAPDVSPSSELDRSRSASSTSTSHGPPSAAATRAGEHRRRALRGVARGPAPRQIGRAIASPARSATAGTAAPAPIAGAAQPAGGDPDRNSTDSARISTSPGKMKHEAAEQRPARAAQTPGAVDRELRRGRARAAGWWRRSPARTAGSSASDCASRTARAAARCARAARRSRCSRSAPTRARSPRARTRRRGTGDRRAAALRGRVRARRAAAPSKLSRACITHPDLLLPGGHPRPHPGRSPSRSRSRASATAVVLPRLLGWNIHQNDKFFLTFLVATAPGDGARAAAVLPRGLGQDRQGPAGARCRCARSAPTTPTHGSAGCWSRVRSRSASSACCWRNRCANCSPRRSWRRPS